MRLIIKNLTNDFSRFHGFLKLLDLITFSTKNLYFLVIVKWI